MTFKEKLQDFDETQKRGDEIFNRIFVPKWFTFLGWLFILGGLYFVYEKTGSTIIGFVFLASLLILFDFLKFYFKFFLEIVSIKSSFINFIVSFIFTGATTYLIISVVLSLSVQ